MQGHVGPELDTEELRARFGAAIATYEHAAEQLDREKIDVRATAFGDGFAAQGMRIVEALEELHGTTLSYLQTRRGNWSTILTLVGDVEATDEVGAVSLTQRGAL